MQPIQNRLSVRLSTIGQAIKEFRKNSSNSNRIKIVWFAFLAVGIGILSYVCREWLTLEQLASSESWLHSKLEAQPLLFYVAAFALYVAVAGLALPGAAALSLAYAWFFGFWPAFILISFASTLGATISFLLSRYFVGNTIQNKFSDRFQKINENFEREGAFYLFSMRLIPAFPFFVVNLLMGLTTINVWTYWWVSQLGMLPGTAVFVYAGSSVPSLHELAENGLAGIFSFKILAAFTLLGVFPIIIKRVLPMFFGSHAQESNQ